MKPFFWHNCVSHLIRAQIRTFEFVLGKDTLIPIIPLRRNQWVELFTLGPSFAYKGDELIWNRKKKEWISVCCEGTFKSLEEIDSFWDDYSKACMGKEVEYDNNPSCK